MATTRRRAGIRTGVGLVLAGMLGVLVGMGLDRDTTATASSDLFAGALPAVPHYAGPPAKRPNVVVVMADDMRTDDLRFMPSVRRLMGRTGLTFRNSFSPDPLCCPARASFLTGDYSHNHGVLSHAAPWGFQAFDDHATLATALRGGGYRTAFVGKYLNGYGRMRSKVTGGPSFRYVPAGWTDWIGAVERPPDSGYSSGGTYDYFHTLFNVNGRIDDTHKGQYQTNVLGTLARNLVTKYSRGRAPFFLYLSSVAPHHGGPSEAGDPMGIRSSGGGTIDLVTPARPDWVKGRFDARLTRAPGLPADGGPAEADLSDKPRPLRHKEEPNRAERAGMLNAARQRAEALLVLDQEVGRLVTRLKRTDEWRNTVLVFTSDNGYFLGEHRIRQGKIKAYEPSLRVPFLVTGAGIPHGRRFDPVTTVDLTATIADLARVESAMPYAADGHSVARSFQADRGWTVPIVTEGHEGEQGTTFFPAGGEPKAAGFNDGRTTIGIRTPSSSTSATPTARPSSTTSTATRTSSRTSSTAPTTWRPGPRCRSCGGVTATAPGPPASSRCPRRCSGRPGRTRRRPTCSRAAWSRSTATSAEEGGRGGRRARRPPGDAQRRCSA
ncbi:sulfatase family protein [Nocardioides mesophilus]|uniref:Sulfatase n=1 Tax=Nocardioides mesophilus TaxID=433659 RepID=A0A7G9RB73_9ACTN|nr:sulfatase [Nocardioides mesophilus]QNN52848.1 sulfatase [Nocardioides mesophilus]